MLLVLCAIFYKELLRKKTLLVLCAFLGLVVISPILLESLKPNALIRFSGTNVFADQANLMDISSNRILVDKNSNDYLGLLFDNRRLAFSAVFINAFLSHFNPSWLFINQSYEAFKVPGFGLFYLFDLIFILLGVAVFLRHQYFSYKFIIFVVCWIVAGILPGAMTNGYPHAMRIYNLLPLPQIIEAV